MHGSLSVGRKQLRQLLMACCLAIPCGNCSPNQVLQSTGVSWSRLQHTCGELVLGILPCACVEPTLTLEPVPAAASPSAPPARAPHFHAVGTAGACKVTASTSSTPGTLGGTTFPAKPCSSAAKCFQDKCCFQLIPLAPGAGLGWPCGSPWGWQLAGTHSEQDAGAAIPNSPGRAGTPGDVSSCGV